MKSLRLVAVPIILGLCLPPIGCGIFRRRRGNTTTNVQSSVEINQSGRDIATLRRGEYEVIETSIGTNKATSVFVLTIPVGSHTTHDEQVDSAYYMAVDRIPECDALLMPRVDTKRTVVPLLLVNIVIKKTTVKGRCVQVKNDAALAGIEEEEAASDSGGGEAPVETEAVDAAKGWSGEKTPDEG